MAMIVEEENDLTLQWKKSTTAGHVISLGAGVQSSTLALMAAVGEVLPMPLAAIFSDTQAEPGGVYKWLDWLEKQLPYPVYRVSQGNLEKADLRIRTSKKSGKIYRSNMIPAFTLTEDGKRGILPRRCTRDYKIHPVQRKAKEVGNVPRHGRTGVYVIQWIGISTDEAIRMKPSREAWTVMRWPLIEKGMSRAACLAWMAQKGYPTPPRSACVFCPYHGDPEWVRLQRDEPEEFKKAVKFERKMQAAHQKSEMADGVPFLHDSRVPLDQVVFDPTPKKKDGFGNECEGMCGV